ncbi:MAG: LptF/LptG family permease [Elusimicrobiota bacterium]
MRILTRYLLRTFLPIFALCVVLCLGVLLMNYFVKLFNVAVVKGISPVWILLCFSRLLPNFLSLALPMAYVVSLLLSLGQLSDTGEVLALRSAGFSFREILAPFFILSACLSGLLLYINHIASPDGFRAFRDLYTDAMSQVSRVSLEPRTLTRVGDWELYADAADEGNGELSGVRLIKREGNYKRLRVCAPQGRTWAEKGRGVHMELKDGTLLWPNDDPASRTSSTFGRYHFFHPFADPRRAVRTPDLQELNTPRLREALKDPSLTAQKRREYTTEAVLRSAGALAPFVLFWISCPLGLSIERRSRAVSFGLSLVVMFGYYGFLALGIGLGRRDLAWSPWSPWLADAVCLACGGVLWRRRLSR